MQTDAGNNGGAPMEDDATFYVIDERTANWVLRKLGNLDAERLRVEAHSARMLAGLKADYDELMRLYGPELEAWARQELMDRGGRKKTLHTWQATLAFRTIPAALKLRDPDAAMRYARERAPEHILTAEKLNTTAYREAASRTLEATGELMPGMDRVPEQEGFSIRFGRKEDGPSDYA